MPRNMISFRIDAVAAYLALHQWQVEHIRAGLAEAEAGEVGRDHDDVFDELEAKLKARLSAR